jgi:peptidoglycan/xylan/chitin deacetylase (PgdA/CDA1 family)
VATLHAAAGGGRIRKGREPILAQSPISSARRAAIRIFLIAAALLALPLASAASAQTTVSLTFDDGMQSQFANARPALASHAMRGTFYVNSGLVGSNSYYATWPQITALTTDGNEIGGHTLTHKRLPDLTAAQQRSQICDDAANLRNHGFNVKSFAYPHGAGTSSTTVRQALIDCGYTSARKVGGLRSSTCSNCSYAETIPPANKWAVKANDWLDTPLTVTELQRYVTQAEQHGGGWVPLMFHDICACGASTISPSEFGRFLDWLKARAVLGTVVKTVGEVINGGGTTTPPTPPPPPPPPPGPDTTPPTASITSPTAGQSVAGTVTVTINATDAGSGIGDVDLYVDSQWTTWSKSTSSPYSISWNATSFGKGTHTLKAFVYDKAGNLTKTAPVSVNVTG